MSSPLRTISWRWSGDKIKRLFTEDREAREDTSPRPSPQRGEGGGSAGTLRPTVKVKPANGGSGGDVFGRSFICVVVAFAFLTPLKQGVNGFAQPNPDYATKVTGGRLVRRWVPSHPCGSDYPVEWFRRTYNISVEKVVKSEV